MKRFLIIMLVSIAAFSFAVPAFAANEERIAELIKRIEAIEEEMKQLNGSIAEEHAKAQTLQRDIAIIKKEIARLESQIVLTTTKINKTKIEITGTEETIFDTERNINRQRETVGELLIYLSQRDSEELVTTLVKHQSLSAFLDQAQQVDNVNNKLLELIGSLRDRKRDLENAKRQLEGKKVELTVLNQENAAKKSSLAGVKSKKDTILTQTKGQEAEYIKMLSAAEQKRNQLFLEMRQLETDVVLGGLYIVHVKAVGLPAGKIPKLFAWPEDDYRITQWYGCTNYAQNWASGLTLSSRSCTPPGPYGGASHNGIDLAGGFGTPIKSIGAGKVIANGFNSGFGNWVAVQHDSYSLVSVYGHMSAYGAIVGTKVARGQVIGYEGDTGQSTGSHVHLSLYKEFFTYEKNKQLYFNYFDGSVNPQNYL